MNTFQTRYKETEDKRAAAKKHGWNFMITKLGDAGVFIKGNERVWDDKTLWVRASIIDSGAGKELANHKYFENMEDALM